MRSRDANLCLTDHHNKQIKVAVQGMTVSYPLLTSATLNVCSTTRGYLLVVDM